MHEAGETTMRVLVAEDEEILAELVATGLRRAGFAVDTVYSGDAALAYLGLHDYDVVVLDRDLPGCTATTWPAAWSPPAPAPGS